MLRNTDKSFIAMLGPNEPGIEGKAWISGFGSAGTPSAGDWDALGLFITSACRRIRSYRDEPGSGTYDYSKIRIAPGAFNISDLQSKEVKNLMPRINGQEGLWKLGLLYGQCLRYLSK